MKSQICLLFLIIIIIVGILVNGNPISDELKFSPLKFKDCKSKFEILSVETTNCAEQDRCVFYRKSDPIIRIAFKPNRPVESLKTSVWAHLGDATGALVRFQLDNDKACNNNNITCPLEVGKTYYYSQSVRILPEYPTIDVQVNWLLNDPDSPKNAEGVPVNRDICIKFLATVKD